MNLEKNIWRLTFGSLIVLFGVLLLLDNLQIVSFKFVWRLYWPVILILLGLIIVLKRASFSRYHHYRGHHFRRHHTEDESEFPSDEKSDLETDAGTQAKYESDYTQSNVFGEVDFSSSSKDYPGGNISNVFGDMYIDLREIDFPGGSRTLSLSGVFGSVRVKTPQNIGVKFSGSTIAGTVKFLEEKRDGLLVNLNSKTAGYDEASKKLIIKASLVFGDIKVH